MITAAYSEIQGAIDQFGDKICGWLSFFDVAVVPLELFEREGEFKIIHPKGCGSTSFDIIFKYISEKCRTRFW